VKKIVQNFVQFFVPIDYILLLQNIFRTHRGGEIMKKVFAIFFLLMLVAPMALAEIDFDSAELSEDEEDLLDEILEPIFTIYNALKYMATVVGVMVLVFAGVSLMTATEPAKKDRAKNMFAGVVIGLTIIWVAPLIVELVFT
jgi:hypothetical protein